MKVSLNDKEVLSLTDMQMKVICNDIDASVFQEDMERRLKWALMHKYDRCFKRLKEEWDPKLAHRIDSVPTDKDEYAQLVFSQPDYKDRAAREKENV